MKDMKNDPSIIEMCTTCKKDECPSNGCPEYHDRLRKLRDAALPKKNSGKAKLLKDLGNAIDALNALGDNPDCNSVFSSAKIKRLAEEIGLARFNCFNRDIDWNDIISKMEGAK